MKPTDFVQNDGGSGMRFAALGMAGVGLRRWGVAVKTVWPPTTVRRTWVLRMSAGCDGEEVAVEDDEVGEEAGFEAAEAGFAELGEGGALGVGVDGLLMVRRCSGWKVWVPASFCG